MELVVWIKDHLGVPYWIQVIIGFGVMLLSIWATYLQSRREARKQQGELVAKLEELYAICLNAHTTFETIFYVIDDQGCDVTADELGKACDPQALQELVRDFDQWQMQGLHHRWFSQFSTELRQMFDTGIQGVQQCSAAFRTQDTSEFFEGHSHLFAAIGTLLIGLQQLRQAIEQVRREPRERA